MTTSAFRRIALSLPDVEESAHMHHPDFRVNGKIFATLGYPDEGCGMVKLSPEDQQKFIEDQPGIFAFGKGAWGLQGCTLVRLRGAKAGMVRKALKAAWQRRMARI